MSTMHRKKMGSGKHKATVENRYLPDDVLWNIFMRLPAKLLAQMKSFCKPWNTLISHPSFIKSHLHYSVHNNPEVLLVFSVGSFSYNEPLKFTAHSSQSPHIQLTDLIKPPCLATNKHNDPTTNNVIGSVNGLICFYANKCIHIWNPSLSALIDIPPFTFPRDYDDTSLRFGFDPKNNDYKVFVAAFSIRFFDWGHNMVEESLQVEVYSVRKGLWESISVRFPSHITLFCNYVDDIADRYDGYLHWICYASPDWREQTLVAFDLSAGTFTEISLPDPLRFGHNYVGGVLSQKLCVISEHGDVWVMDIYGVAKSWVKKLHVLDEQVNRSVIPLGFTSSNEFICQLNDDDVALYDPNTTVVKLFEIRNSGWGTNIIPYVDSLVWPVQPKKKQVDMGTTSARPKRNVRRPRHYMD